MPHKPCKEKWMTDGPQYREALVKSAGRLYACRGSKITGMLCVSQDLGAKTGGKEAAGMCLMIDSVVP